VSENETIARIVASAGSEGRRDYLGRAAEVASGSEEAEWAWPFAGADEAYLAAVGITKICRDLGLPASAWDEISDTWLRAFRAGYVQAHEEARSAMSPMDILRGLPRVVMEVCRHDLQEIGDGAE